GQLGDLALGLEGEVATQVAVGHGGHDARDAAHLARQVARHRVDVVGEVLPGAGHVLDVGLAAELALGADLPGDARNLGRERAELVDHPVDGVLEVEDLAPHVDADLARKIAGGDGLGDVGDVPDLGRQVAGHRIDRIGQVFPRAGDFLDVGLAAELALGADLARDARNLGPERPELVGHRVDGVLELEDLAAHVAADLGRKIAGGDGLGDVGDVADLGGEVTGHRVDGVGEVLPGAGHVLDVGLATELALGTHFAGDARDLGGERAELVDHPVDGVLELENLAAAVDGDLAREVAVPDGARFRGDVADLGGEVAGHRVDGVSEVFPRAGDAAHVGLAAELALGADLARDPGDLGGERAELVDHRVD